MVLRPVENCCRTDNSCRCGRAREQAFQNLLLIPLGGGPKGDRKRQINICRTIGKKGLATVTEFWA